MQTVGSHELVVAGSITPLDIGQILTFSFWSLENWCEDIKGLIWDGEVKKKKNSRVDTRWLLLPDSEFFSLFHTVKPVMTKKKEKCQKGKETAYWHRGLSADTGTKKRNVWNKDTDTEERTVERAGERWKRWGERSREIVIWDCIPNENLG